MQFSSVAALGSHPKESLPGLPGIPRSVRPLGTWWTTFEEPKCIQSVSEDVPECTPIHSYLMHRYATYCNGESMGK